MNRLEESHLYCYSDCDDDDNDKISVLCDYSLEFIEREIKKYTLLKFKNNVKISSMEEFLNVFFIYKNTYLLREYGDTYYVDNGKIQCVGVANRSHIDGYRTALYYFPKLSFSSWISMLNDNINYAKTYWFFWCPDIEEYVISTNRTKDKALNTFSKIDFNKYLNK
jgi:hypothetical protein